MIHSRNHRPMTLSTLSSRASLTLRRVAPALLPCGRMTTQRSNPLVPTEEFYNADVEDLGAEGTHVHCGSAVAVCGHSGL
ncbi:hypothetical protein CDAR_393341 [Caerostris darwini]|uniref:Uncharacterized protein n=1 Tax=Caerostris darwini TaxID=1538125 RepID=A0AAV4QCW0_9ARAC|nr:hypothetical protein CDAR_393341 [Caerostris darwini]